MHIPSCESQRVELLDFDEALRLSGRGDSYDRSVWLYVPDFYTEYRYILGTRGLNPLICIGINPSTAEPGNLDNTLKSVARIAAGNGFDSWIMFNVYAQRATRPDDMHHSCNARLHYENMRAFEYVLSEVGRACARPYGPPGAPSSKSDPICPTVCAIWWRSASATTPAGCVPVPFPKRGTPTIRCICERTSRYVLLM